MTLSGEKRKKGFLWSKFGKNELWIFLGIVAVVAVLLFFGSGSKTVTTEEDYSLFEKWCLNEQERAEVLLGKIKGAGKVKVLITFDGSAEKVYARKTVSRTSGGVTTVTEEIVYNSGKPVLVTETAPKIKGIVVVAEGAGNARVKLEIVRAVMTLYGVEASAVEVFASK